MGAKDYRNAQIVVHWDAVRCIHTGICTRGLPQVFDVSRRPWITVDSADADAIAKVVERCPTGALRYSRLDDRPPEPVPEVLTFTPMRNGPLFVRGPVRVAGPDGSVVAEETRVALCRCGATANPPYCDNSHRAIDFSAPAGAAAELHSPALSPQEICQQQDF